MRPTADHQVLDTGVERIGGFVRLVPDSPASRGSREAVIPRTYKYKLLWWNSFALRLLFARFPNAGDRDKSQQPRMVKSLSALAIFSLLGASLMALPGIAYTVQAREVAVLAKGDRLQVHAAAMNCSSQVWPDFAASCLRSTNPNEKLEQVRFVSARR
jgi:hypothetical protein